MSKSNTWQIILIQLSYYIRVLKCCFLFPVLCCASQYRHIQTVWAAAGQQFKYQNCFTVSARDIRKVICNHCSCRVSREHKMTQSFSTIGAIHHLKTRRPVNTRIPLVAHWCICTQNFWNNGKIQNHSTKVQIGIKNRLVLPPVLCFWGVGFHIHTLYGHTYRSAV